MTLTPETRDLITPLQRAIAPLRANNSADRQEPLGPSASVKKDHSNSGKPPLSDGFGSKQPPRLIGSARVKSGNESSVRATWRGTLKQIIEPHFAERNKGPRVPMTFRG
jgi:hypothetical protein